MTERQTNAQTLQGLTSVRTGLVLLASSALSSVTSFTVDNVFKPQFTSFLFVMHTTGATGSVTLQFRVGGVTTATSYARQELFAGSTSVSASRSSAQTNFSFQNISVGGVVADILRPNLAEQTTILARGLGHASFDTTQPEISIQHGGQTAGTIFDGLIVTAQFANTLIGRYYIFGYRGNG